MMGDVHQNVEYDIRLFVDGISSYTAQSYKPSKQKIKSEAWPTQASDKRDCFHRLLIQGNWCVNALSYLLNKWNSPCTLWYLYRRGRRKHRRMLDICLKRAHGLCVNVYEQLWSASATPENSYFRRKRCQNGICRLTFAQVTVFAHVNIFSAGVVGKIAEGWALAWRVWEVFFLILIRKAGVLVPQSHSRQHFRKQTVTLPSHK